VDAVLSCHGRYPRTKGALVPVLPRPGLLDNAAMTGLRRLRRGVSRPPGDEAVRPLPGCASTHCAMSAAYRAQASYHLTGLSIFRYKYSVANNFMFHVLSIFAQHYALAEVVRLTSAMIGAVLLLGASGAPKHVREDPRCGHEVLRRRELRRGRRDSSPSAPPSVVLELRLDSGFAVDACYLCRRVLSSEGTAAPTGAGPACLRAAAICSTWRRYFQ
jgi:hypothetical protein